MLVGRQFDGTAAIFSAERAGVGRAGGREGGRGGYLGLGYRAEASTQKCSFNRRGGVGREGPRSGDGGVRQSIHNGI